MTPLEKANELYSKFDNLLNKDFIHPIVYNNQLKKCALIAVNEILNEFPNGIKGSFEEKRKYYWQEVKQEIEKL
jgi:ribosomal protein S17E